LGCGLGDDTFQIAERVGATGRVTGVDVSASMIDEAERRAATRGMPVNFEVGDSQALRFTDGTFDGVRAERMLMHVPERRPRDCRNGPRARSGRTHFGL
jgi:ubiquinone/menaquinone biosynthesis C-methylase UbiE